MTQPTYTDSQIFKHMTPPTSAAWVGDIERGAGLFADEKLDTADAALMYSAICELFALVGADAIALLNTYGINADHPLVMAVVEAYNAD